MEVIFMLIGFSLVIAILFLGLFFWAVRSGQYDDAHTPAIRMLFDDKKVSSRQEESTDNKQDKD